MAEMTWLVAPKAVTRGGKKWRALAQRVLELGPPPGPAKTGALRRLVTGKVFEDTFTRADGALGANWRAQGGMAIVAGEVVCGPQSGNTYSSIVAAAAGVRDRMVVQARITKSALDLTSAGIVATGDQANFAPNYGHHFGLTQTGVEMVAYVGGVGTVKGTAEFTQYPGARYAMRVAVKPGRQRCWVEGVPLLDLSDTSVPYGTNSAAWGQAGIRQVQPNGSTAQVKYDDILICSSSDITVGGVPEGYTVRLTDLPMVNGVGPAGGGTVVLDTERWWAPHSGVEIVSPGGVTVALIEPAGGVYPGDEYQFVADVPTAVAHTDKLLLRDGFNRADGALGASWVNHAGSAWAVAGGTAYCNSGSGERTMRAVHTAAGTQVVRLQVQRGATGSDLTVYTLWDAASNCYAFQFDTAGTALNVWRQSAGTWTQLGSYAVASPVGTWLDVRILVSPSIQRCWVNGSLWHAGADTAHNGKTGVIGLRTQGTATGPQRFDDVVVAPGPTLVVNGLPAGHGARVGGVTAWADANGTATLDMSLTLGGATAFPWATLEVIKEADGSVVLTTSPADGIYPGDTFSVS